jgi:aminoglycoside 2''-phosphotransferase
MNALTSYIHAIHDVYPALLIEAAHLNQQGQFNDVLVINNEYIFRFPKTQREALKLDRETKLFTALRITIKKHLKAELRPIVNAFLILIAV